jgi:hypothetical protein
MNTMIDPRMQATSTSRLRGVRSRCSILADRRRVAMEFQIVKLEDVDDWLGDYPGEMRGITKREAD